MKLFSWYFKSKLLIRILTGLILGAVCGIAFMVSTGFAVFFGLICGNLFKPGHGMQIVATATGGLTGDIATPSLVDTLINIVPVNPFGAVAEGNVLPVIFFFLLFGIGLSYVRNSEDENISKSGETVFRFFNGGAEIMYRLVNWILQYAPIGVFALIADVFGKQGAEAFGPLGYTTLAVYIGFIGHRVVVYGAMLLLFGVNPVLFFNKAKEGIITAFVTRSSGGILPASMGIAENKMDLTLWHKDGSAISTDTALAD